MDEIINAPEDTWEVLLETLARRNTDALLGETAATKQGWQTFRDEMTKGVEVWQSLTTTPKLIPNVEDADALTVAAKGLRDSGTVEYVLQTGETPGIRRVGKSGIFQRDPKPDMRVRVTLNAQQVVVDGTVMTIRRFAQRELKSLLEKV